MGGQRLEVVARGCKWWQEVASGGQSLQVVARGCKWWLELASGGKRLQVVVLLTKDRTLHPSLPQGFLRFQKNV